MLTFVTGLKPGSETHENAKNASKRRVEISFILLALDFINTQHKAKYSILYTKYKHKNFRSMITKMKSYLLTVD